MDFLRDKFLAGAGLAGDENSAIGGSHLLDLMQHALDAGACADDFAVAVNGIYLCFEILAFSQQTLLQLFNFGL